MFLFGGFNFRTSNTKRWNEYENYCRRQRTHGHWNRRPEAQLPKVGNTQRDKAAGQTIRDNREDRRAIGSGGGGRLKAWGRDTGYMCWYRLLVYFDILNRLLCWKYRQKRLSLNQPEPWTFKRFVCTVFVINIVEGCMSLFSIQTHLDWLYQRKQELSVRSWLLREDFLQDLKFKGQEW